MCDVKLDITSVLGTGINTVRYVVEVSFEGNTVVIGLCHVP
jgi:hypothetical protein